MYMRVKVCRKAGCSRACEPGKTYCVIHSSLENKIFTKRTTSSPYNYLYRTARWRKERAEFLSRYPYCAICNQLATVVDHIKPHKGNEEIFWNQDNWQPLCASCHTKKTFKENNNFNKGKY